MSLDTPRIKSRNEVEPKKLAIDFKSNLRLKAIRRMKRTDKIYI